MNQSLELGKVQRYEAEKGDCDHIIINPVCHTLACDCIPRLRPSIPGAQPWVYVNGMGIEAVEQGTPSPVAEEVRHRYDPDG